LRPGARLGAAAVLAVIALWIAIHRVSWLGPALADGLRALIGTEAVTRLEEWAYGAQDRFNRAWRRRQPPKAYWSAPSAEPPGPAPHVPQPESQGEGRRAFPPPSVGPFDARAAASGDGVWVAVADPGASTYSWSPATRDFFYVVRREPAP
jgi:hypothetical protein